MRWKITGCPCMHTNILCYTRYTIVQKLNMHYSAQGNRSLTSCEDLATAVPHHLLLHTVKSSYPVKMLLQDLTRKDPFSCIPARSCKILQDLAGSCEIMQESCTNLEEILCKVPVRFLQNPTRSCRILQDPAGSCKILQGCKKKGPFLVRSCKSVFTG